MIRSVCLHCPHKGGPHPTRGAATSSAYAHARRHVRYPTSRQDYAVTEEG